MIWVPVGTEVRRPDRDEVLADLDQVGAKAILVRGGLGGRGNTWFARAEYRAPRIAQRGQPGQEVEVQLDLKLLADVGIVGLPNAGKSTLLAAISAARPKVAEYPFTTLEPALGVVEAGWERFVVADIPGVIEGAHEGAGLGLDFLRHIERTKVIVQLVDGGADDPIADLDAVSRELAEYGHGLAERPRLIAVNKVDLPPVAARSAELASAIESRFGERPLVISAAGRVGVDELVERMALALSQAEEQPTPVAAAELPVIRPQPLARRFEVEREGDGFRVIGQRVVAFAEMMPTGVEEGRQELWWRLGRWGVSGRLRKAGARPGDRVRLGSVELEWPG